MIKKLIYRLTGGSSCRSAESFLMDYVEGRLDQRTANRFDAHINMCPNCKRYLDQYRATIAMTAEIPPPRIPVELEEQTCDFILSAFGSNSEGRHDVDAGDTERIS